MFDLLVVGDCNPDLVIEGGDVTPEFGQREKLVERAELVIGGSAAITACGAATLGLRTAFVGAVGDDLFGRFMLDGLAGRGVDVSGCPVHQGRPTGLTVALVRGSDRAILTAAGTIRLLGGDDVDRGLVRRARHLHVASYYLLDGLRPGLPRLVAHARAAGLSVSLDPQGDPADIWDSGLEQLLPEIDVLFVNAAEDEAIDSSMCPLVVVKRGAAGASARSATETTDVRGLAVEAVDATGAGDSFDAGFLVRWLAGATTSEALELGCACGALSTRALGGTAAQPTLEEAVEALA